MMPKTAYSRWLKVVTLALGAVLVVIGAIATTGVVEARKSGGGITLNFNCDEEKPGMCVCKGGPDSPDCQAMKKNCVNECPDQPGSCTIVKCDGEGCECSYQARWWKPKHDRFKKGARPDNTAPSKSP
jgi:hypothetical protein